MSRNRYEAGNAPKDDRELLALAWGWRSPLMMLEAHKAGVFEAAAGGWKSARELAQALEADERAVEFLAMGLCGAGLMQKWGDKFRNAPVVERYLIKSSRDYRGYALELEMRLVTSWLRISEVVKTGQPIPKPEVTQREKDAWQEVLIRALDNITSTSVEPLLKIMPLSDGQRLLDIGCGSAKHLVEILRRYPASTAVGFDRPNSEKMILDAVIKGGVEGRLVFRGGDFLQDAFTDGGPFDGILISKVIHNLSDEQAADLVRRAAEALNPGGFLTMHEMTIQSVDDPGPAAVFGVHMMLGTAVGRIYSRDEIVNFMRGAGLQFARSCHTDARSEALVARKPAAD